MKKNYENQSDNVKSKIHTIVEKEGRDFFAKATKRAEDMYELFADMIHIGQILRSYG